MRKPNARWWLPWRVVAWLGTLNVWCWADLSLWKSWGDDRPIRRNTACAFESTKDGGRLTCYCGFWDHGPDARIAANSPLEGDR